MYVCMCVCVCFGEYDMCMDVGVHSSKVGGWGLERGGRMEARFL